MTNLKTQNILYLPRLVYRSCSCFFFSLTSSSLVISLGSPSTPWCTLEHLEAPGCTFDPLFLGAVWATDPLYWLLAPRLGPTGRSQLLHFLSVQLQRPARPDGGWATNHGPPKMCQPITDRVWLGRPIHFRQEILVVWEECLCCL